MTLLLLFDLSQMKLYKIFFACSVSKIVYKRPKEKNVKNVYSPI